MSNPTTTEPRAHIEVCSRNEKNRTTIRYMKKTRPFINAKESGFRNQVARTC